jgi:hypothetical protein
MGRAVCGLELILSVLSRQFNRIPGGQEKLS